MSNEKRNIKKPSILICGSSDLTDKNFVFSVLSLINESLESGGTQIGTIHTSKFAGACHFAKNWALHHNERCVDVEKRIKIKDFSFDLHLEERNHSFYEEVEIPLPVLRNDPFYKKGQEQLSEKGFDLILAFPNNLGKIGPSTANIKRFALLAGTRYMNCADIYKKLQEKAELISREHNAQLQKPSMEAQGNYEEQPQALVINRRALSR